MSTSGTSSSAAADTSEVPKASKKREIACNLCLYPNIVKVLTKIRHKVQEIENLLYPQLNTRTARVAEIGICLNDMLHYLYAGSFNYCRCRRACNDNIHQMMNLLESNVNKCEEYLIDMRLMRKRSIPKQKKTPTSFNYIWIRYRLIMINRRTAHVKKVIEETKNLFNIVSNPTVFPNDLLPNYFRNMKRNK